MISPVCKRRLRHREWKRLLQHGHFPAAVDSPDAGHVGLARLLHDAAPGVERDLADGAVDALRHQYLLRHEVAAAVVGMHSLLVADNRELRVDLLLPFVEGGHGRPDVDKLPLALLVALDQLLAAFAERNVPAVVDRLVLRRAGGGIVDRRRHHHDARRLAALLAYLGEGVVCIDLVPSVHALPQPRALDVVGRPARMVLVGARGRGGVVHAEHGHDRRRLPQRHVERHLLYAAAERVAGDSGVAVPDVPLGVASVVEVGQKPYPPRLLGYRVAPEHHGFAVLERARRGVLHRDGGKRGGNCRCEQN